MMKAALEEREEFGSFMNLRALLLTQSYTVIGK